MAGNRREFDRSLEDIEAKVIELFAMIAEDLPAATRALLGGGAESVSALAGREQLIDALYVEIEELAGREILLQAPVASDLRFLLTVLRVVPEIERSHDLVMDIASRASRVRGPAPGRRRDRRRDGGPRLGHVAAGGRCLVRPRPVRRGGPGRAGRRAARPPDRRDRRRADAGDGGDGDDAGGARFTGAWGPTPSTSRAGLPTWPAAGNSAARPGPGDGPARLGPC